ncbi:MAG: methylated-DNA--[protein]-cysteine S-methyltransferase [Candidatus Cryptobacteroides sp.]
MDYIWHYDSPLGGMTMASDGQALIGLWFDGQKYFGEVLDSGYEECFLPVFDQTCRWLAIYFSGKVPDFMPAISLRASAFRKRVLNILLTIPWERGYQIADGRVWMGYAKSNGRLFALEDIRSGRG